MAIFGYHLMTTDTPKADFSSYPKTHLRDRAKAEHGSSWELHVFFSPPFGARFFWSIPMRGTWLRSLSVRCRPNWVGWDRLIHTGAIKNPPFGPGKPSRRSAARVGGQMSWNEKTMALFEEVVATFEQLIAIWVCLVFEGTLVLSVLKEHQKGNPPFCGSPKNDNY